MRVHVVYAHPSPTSFVAALHAETVRVLRAGGHDVDDLDLYAEAFDPVLSLETYRHYVDSSANTREVASYVARLRAAEALVLAFPVWFDGLPAILVGYLQRVFLPGVSVIIDDKGLFHRNLKNLRRLAAVCTYGENRHDIAAKGDPPRRFIHKNIGILIAPDGRIEYFAHYNMNYTEAGQRAAFLARVVRAFKAW